MRDQKWRSTVAPMQFAVHTHTNSFTLLKYSLFFDSDFLSSKKGFRLSFHVNAFEGKEKGPRDFVVNGEII